MKHIRKPFLSLLIFTASLLLLCGPGGTWLQSRQQWAAPEDNRDAVYLVCGARAQDRRITALCRWIQRQTEVRDRKVEVGAQRSGDRSRRPEGRGQKPASRNQPSPLTTPHSPHSTVHTPLSTILVGNDPQKSLWCREHQTNHTKTEWAVQKLKTETGGQRSEDQEFRNHSALSSPITIVPGTFSNTDGEMEALATYLKAHPEIQSIALVTSRFHARRLLQCYDRHIGQSPTVSIIPGVSYWENRAPWIILGEYAKLLRDKLGLTDKLTRPKPRTAEK